MSEPGAGRVSVAARRAAAWAAVVAMFLLLRVPGLLGNSATYDEPIYIGASMHWTALADDHAAAMLYHPPLSYHLIDLPLRFLDAPLRPWDAAGANTQVGLGVLYESTSGGAPVDPRTVLLLARLPILLVGALGLVLAFRLGRRLGGDAAAWLAAVAWAAFPEAAAQSIQATTDCVAAVAALFLADAALGFLAEVRDGRAPRAWLLGLAAGIALLSKHTLLVHVAVVAGALLLLRAWTWRRAAVAAGVAALVVWTGYGFEFRAAVPATGPHETLDGLARVLHVSPAALEGPARTIPIPAPTYVRSVLDALLSKATARGGTPWTGYLNGEWSTRGFWTYFPLATLYKTPVSLLVLTAAGMLALPQLLRERRAAVLLLLALFGAGFAAAVASRLNIGFRHLLPTLPFLCVVGLAGLAVRVAGRPRATLLVAAFAAMLGAESLQHVRDPIPAANVFAGGREGLHRRLSDSNLEVGQDLERVREWARANGVERITAMLHGPPGLYERECARDPLFERFDVAPTGGLLWSIRPGDQSGPVPPRGLLAVGESVMTQPRWGRWLLPLPPLAVVGRTRIYVLPK